MKLSSYLDRNCASIQEFADKTGLSRNAVVQMYHGRTNPRVDTAMRVHKATRGKVTWTDLIVERD